MATWIKPLFVITVALGLTACATSKDDVIPQDGPDMATPVSYTHLRAHETTCTISYAVFCL